MRDVKSQAARKNEKIRKKSVARKLKERRLGFVKLLAMCAIVFVTALGLLGNIEKLREKNAMIAETEKEYNRLRIQNEAMRQRLSEPYDDEYIMKIARENGYRTYDEIMFYITAGD